MVSVSERVRYRWPAASSSRRIVGVVVDLAVERHPDRLVFVGQRLVTAGQVDDAQTPVSEGAAGGQVQACAVGPAMGHDVAHQGGARRFVRMEVVSCRDTGNPAHDLVNRPFSSRAPLEARADSVRRRSSSVPGRDLLRLSKRSATRTAENRRVPAPFSVVDVRGGRPTGGKWQIVTNRTRRPPNGPETRDDDQNRQFNDAVVIDAR